MVTNPSACDTKTGPATKDDVLVTKFFNVVLNRGSELVGEIVETAEEPKEDECLRAVSQRFESRYRLLDMFCTIQVLYNVITQLACLPDAKLGSGEYWVKQSS